MNVLVLGATGMLGSMAYDYLSKNTNFNVIGTSRRKVSDLLYFDVYDGIGSIERENLKLKDLDYVINCIGITKPYCHDDNIDEVVNATQINSIFPHKLAKHAEENDFRVIQIATDCVFSGLKGQYVESSLHDALDVYGKTKSLGEVKSNRFLNIRCSIVGPERFNKVFLLEWFQSQSVGSTISGYTNHLWNGVTTLQFAELCRRIITSESFDRIVEESAIHHFCPNQAVTKYELLTIFSRVLDKKIDIIPTENQFTVKRTLTTKYNSLKEIFASDEDIETTVRRCYEYAELSGLR